MATPCDRAARRTSSRSASALLGVGAASTAAGSTRSGTSYSTSNCWCARRWRRHPPGRGSRGPCAPATSSSPSAPWCAAPRLNSASRSRAVTGPRSRTAARTPGSRAGSAVKPHLPRCCAVRRHPVLHHRPQVDGHERLDVGPVLHHPARPALGSPAQQVDVVRAHPRVERHVVGALEDVDRVHLQDAGAAQGALERAHRGGRVRAVREALGGQCDPARLQGAEAVRHATHGPGVPVRAGPAAFPSSRT